MTKKFNTTEEYEEQKRQEYRTKVKIAAGAAIALVSLGILFSLVHRNDIQEFTVVQTPLGRVWIQGDGGYYFSFFPRTWTYSKVSTVYFSNETDESKDQDGVKVRFKNKGEGDISSQVVYRLYNTNEQILSLHQYVSGSQDRIDDLIWAKLKDIVMEKASAITSSEAIENREALAAEIRKDFVNNAELLTVGIKIEQFSITQISFDPTTTALFEAQQKADLQKKTAEAEEANLQMQKKRTEAEYEQKIAESKGKAEVEKIKQVTDAERQKELAEIAAKQRVEVAKLDAEEARVEAEKKLKVAEIEKNEEEKKLEIIKLKSQQKVAEAEAKQKELELARGISDQEKYQLDIRKETTIGVAKAIAEGIKGWSLPKIVTIGGAEMNGGNAFENWINMSILEKINSADK